MKQRNLVALNLEWKTMTNRRDFLTHSILGAGALGRASTTLVAGSSANKPPTRFIFIHKGNGLHPHSLVPPTFDDKQMEAEKRKDSFAVDLDDHDLPEWMSPIAGHKNNLTILQGLSGKMCTTGHHTWCSSLGVFKANERLSSIKWATVDFELAKMFPSPFGHIEFACFPAGGGNSRGNINGIEKGFSARGPQQPNYAFGSPKVAMQELFKSVATDRQALAQYQLQRKVLEFVAQREASLAQSLTGTEQPKVANYADAVQDIRKRNGRVEAMGDVLRQHLPQLDRKYLADDISTVDRQVGFTEILLSTLISGMTNVVTFTVDELGTNYTGLPGIEGENVNQHDVGHGKPVRNFAATDVRKKIRHQHMTVIDSIVSRLKSVPEADGTMFDNTMLFYFPDNGETHHSNGSEWPFLVLAGDNTQLDIGRRYMRLPGYGKPGHKTLGNWYTTILNGYGNSINHFGSPDVGLTIDQTGPIEQFLG
jgi:hypothetical protein